MARGQKILTAADYPHKGPHRTALIRSAIYTEMVEFPGAQSFISTLSSFEICDILARVGYPITESQERALLAFADYLDQYDATPPAKLPSFIKAGKLAGDLGLY